MAADAARVLVIDDDSHSAYLQKGLLMAAGHQVVVAADVDAALAAARGEPVALVVVAATVPDAAALVAIFEHDPETRKAAVLAVGEAGKSGELIAAGADEFLERPIQPQFPHRRLRPALGRRRPPRGAAGDGGRRRRLGARDLPRDPRPGRLHRARPRERRDRDRRGPAVPSASI